MSQIFFFWGGGGGVGEAEACYPGKRVLLIPGTGNGERGTGNRERESGNECTAVIRIRIQNGGRNHGKGSGN